MSPVPAAAIAAAMVGKVEVGPTVNIATGFPALLSTLQKDARINPAAAQQSVQLWFRAGQWASRLNDMC
jgi:hypothetical protein